MVPLTVPPRTIDAPIPEVVAPAVTATSSADEYWLSLFQYCVTYCDDASSNTTP